MSRVWTQTQNQNQINLGLDSEFNSIHFGIETNKRLKVLAPKNVWVKKLFFDLFENS